MESTGPDLPAQSITGAVLAGGQSRRMEGGHKALLELAGTTMLERVVDRVQGQVENVLVSVEPDAEAFRNVHHSLVEDRVASHRGPLAGLYSCLEYMQRHLDTPWLLLCPCDAPFVPLDLAQRLGRGAIETGKRVCTAAYEGHPQPTFSLWHRDVFPDVRVAVLEKGRGGLMSMLAELGAASVEWPACEISPFYNINSPKELQQAGRWLDRGTP